MGWTKAAPRADAGEGGVLFVKEEGRQEQLKGLEGRNGSRFRGGLRCSQGSREGKGGVEKGRREFCTCCKSQCAAKTSCCVEIEQCMEEQRGAAMQSANLVLATEKAS